MTAQPLPRQTEREYERFHLLATVVTYPSLSTHDVRDRANEECQHDLFDPLPLMTPQSVSGKLKALERDGLIESWVDFNGVRWDPTDEGRKAWAFYEAYLKADAVGKA